MKIVLILGGILIAFLSYRNSKKWYNPVTVFSIYWTLLSSISMIGAFGFNIPSEQTYFIVFLGIMSFSIGALLYHIFPRFIIKRHGRMRLGEVRGFEFKKKLTYTLCIIVILYLFYRSLLSIRLLLGGKRMDTIRALYFSDENVDASSSILLLIDSFIIKPFTMAIISIATANFFSSNQDKWLLRYALAIILFSVLVNGGRVVILYLVINLLVSFLLMNKKIYITRKQKKIIRCIIALAGIAVVYVTFQRKRNVVLLEEAYRYFAGAIVQFDGRLKVFSQNPQYTHGFASLRGFIMPIMIVLKKLLGFNYSDAYIRASEIGTNLQRSINIGTNVWMKAFSTLYYFFYLDAGLVGVGIFSSLYGFASASAFHKAQTKPNLYTISQYGLLIQGIVLSMVRWQFYLPNYAWSFVFAMLLVKKRKKGQTVIPAVNIMPRGMESRNDEHTRKTGSGH